MKRNSPTRSLSGFAVVVALHVAFAIALINGLVRPPVTEKPHESQFVPIVPDKPKVRPQPVDPVEHVTPRFVIPMPQDPPPFQQTEPTVTGSTEPPPVNPVAPERVATAGPPATIGAASTVVGVACPNSQSVRTSMRYPPQARRDGLQGDVVARFLVAANGEIRNINIVSSTNRAFNSAVVSAVGQFSCLAQGRDVTVEVPFAFRLE